MELKDLKEKNVVVVSNLEEAKEFMQLLDENGYRWCNKRRYIEDNSAMEGIICYLDDGQKVAFHVHNGEYSSLDWYSRRSYNLIPVSNFSSQKIWEF